MRNKMINKTTIDFQRLKELERKEAKLNALERGGVDNWDAYDDALAEYRIEIELEEKIEACADDILEEISQFIEQPAGIGCGYGFKDGAQQIIVRGFKKVIKEINEGED
jgi:hypothetical protein